MRHPLLFLAIWALLACTSDRERRAFEERQAVLQDAAPPQAGAEARPVHVRGRVVLPFEQENGVMIVQATVNGTPCRFIFDSGANSVCLSLTEARHMAKNKYLSREDILGEEQYMDASGDINTGMKVNLRELKIGDILLQNVVASIINSENAANLLGQSALEKFGRVTIDYSRQEIVLEGD